MAFAIGNVQIENPVFLAPMSGVTDLPFRRVVKRYGAGLVISEMIASRAMVMQKRDTMRMAKHTPEEFPMAVQLAGCEPEVMAEAAKLNEDLGAQIIDINFGCPVKKVVNGHAGSSLMRDEPLCGKILEATVKAVKIPVTLKMRMGWDHSSLNAPKIAKIAEDAGIKMITVHGRTRNQMYTGKADWKFIRTVKEAVKLPVIANGDIVEFAHVKQALADSGADGVMIGRGCYGRPWFVGQVIKYLQRDSSPLVGERTSVLARAVEGEQSASPRGLALAAPPQGGSDMPSAPSLAEQYALICEHYEAMLSHYGVEAGVRMARKHLGWYSGGLPGSAAFRSQVMQCGDAAEVRRMLREFYEPLLEGKWQVESGKWHEDTKSGRDFPASTPAGGGAEYEAVC